MATPARPAAPDERGFILVGVITFMLVLTILGLSLFALSSYESQFFGASATHEQALQNCESGMELVKGLLQSRYPQRLENAQLVVGQFCITSALAYQWQSGNANDTLSQGPVQWDSTLVIVVTARSGGSERTVEAKFVPSSDVNPYQRLISAGGNIRYLTNNSTDPSIFRMSGRVWQYVRSASDTAWTRQVTWLSGRPLEITPTPTPLADAFVDAKLTGSLPQPSVEFDYGSQYTMKFFNYGSAPKFFKSPPSPTDEDTREEQEYEDFTFYSYPTMDIEVRGTVVWVVPEGVCFRHRVEVLREGTDDATLIIVAKANGQNPGNENRAIWFQGGLKIVDSDTRVYLVSQGDIAITYLHGSSYARDARGLSIVTEGNVELGGPDPDEDYQIWYLASSMDPLGIQLLSQGALPPVVGGSSASFIAARGYWLETTSR